MKPEARVSADLDDDRVTLEFPTRIGMSTSFCGSSNRVGWLNSESLPTFQILRFRGSLVEPSLALPDEQYDRRESSRRFEVLVAIILVLAYAQLK